MPTARNRVTGAVVSADEATLRRLGSLWQVEVEKPAKPAPTRRRAKKSDNE